MYLSRTFTWYAYNDTGKPMWYKGGKYLDRKYQEANAELRVGRGKGKD